MKRLFASTFVMALLLCGLVISFPIESAHAADFACGTSGSYTVTGTTVTSNTNCLGNLTIDSSVTTIATGAFSNAVLAQVTIPGTVTTIEASSFNGITITGLTLGEGIQSIGFGAFYGMNSNNLNITLPNSLTALGAKAFENSRFGALIVGNGLTSIPEQAFYNNFGAGVTSVTLGSGLQSIGFASFQGFRGTQLDIPEGVTTLQGRAFEDSASLRELFLPNSLTTIGTDAFNNAYLSFALYCGSSSGVTSYPFESGITTQCGKVASFNANGGSGTMNPQIVSPGTQTALTSNAFTWSGYEFAGWNTQSDGQGTNYSNGQLYNFNSHLKLFAQWAPIPRVDFDANGGSGGMSSQYSSTPTTLNANTFERCNYTFDGWSTSRDGSGIDYSNGQVFPFTNPLTTLFAQWLSTGNTQNSRDVSWGPVVSASSQPAFNDRLWDMEINPRTGDLYAAGFFTNVDGIAAADYIARWNGTSWSALGTGTNVLSPGTGAGNVGVFDIAFDSAGNLYATGNFKVNGIANYVAKWNGSEWSGLGSVSSFSNPGRAVAVDSSDNIYVGGQFVDVAGIGAADYIAKWNGTSWSSLGSSPALTSYVQSLALSPSGNLYVGTFSTNVGGVASADYIAKWNGSSWAGLGSTNAGDGRMVFPPRTIKVDYRTGSDILYVGLQYPYLKDATGNFTQTGFLQKWDGNGWSQGFSDVQMNGPITALEFPANGGVIAAGWFDATGVNFATACNTMHKKLVYFDGTVTQALGSDGTSPAFDQDSNGGFYGGGRGIDSLAITSDGRLFVGGTFANAGGNAQSDWIALSSTLFPVSVVSSNSGATGGTVSTVTDRKSVV